MPVRTVAVIGTGTMGRGVALACLQVGLDAVIHDLDRERAAHLATELGSHKRRAEGATVRAAEQLRDAVAGADVVIECVPELLAIKSEVLGTVMSTVGPDTLVATNTSTMSISTIAGAIGADGHLVGMHFFNPAEKMRLVEIIRAPDTPEELVTQSRDFVETLGKTSIVVEDSPGFVTSRLGLIMGTEAMRMVETGIASAQAIDTAMRLGYNHPMGPIELADLVGLDARLNNLRAVYDALGDEAYRPPAILEELVASGALGRKTGRGFYEYDKAGKRKQ